MSWAALALLIVIAVNAFVLWIGKKAYSLMEWRFCKDRLEYTIGIFGGIRETIRDMKTQPAGNSGNRVGCGVFK